MTIYFAHEAQGHGGFVCGDTETGHTAYAYWSSVNWTNSHRHPEAVARSMLAGESATLRTPPNVRDYDCRNWNKLAGLVL